SHPAAVDGADLLTSVASGPPSKVIRCRHIAQALAAIAGFANGWQAGTTLMATAVSVVMLAALPDLRSALAPASPPATVAPASPLPYYLWVSLDTDRPAEFQVVLESL